MNAENYVKNLKVFKGQGGTSADAIQVTVGKYYTFDQDKKVYEEVAGGSIPAATFDGTNCFC